MKVSDLAKELGFKTADLITAAKDKGIEISGVRAVLDTKTVAALRSTVPAHTKTTKTKKITAKGAAEKPEPEKATKPIRKTTAAKTEKTITAPATPPAAPHAAAKPPAPPPLPPKAEAPPEPQIETPVIDVDKIVGVEKEIRVLHPNEMDIDADKSDTEAGREKKRFKPVPAKPAAPAAIAEPVKEKLKPKESGIQVRRFATSSPQQAPFVPPMDRKIEIPVPITIKDFSQLIGVKVNLILKKLIEKNIMVTINSTIRDEAVMALGVEFNRDVTIKKSQGVDESMLMAAAPDRPEDLVPRSPIVTFMGHVDHGKTSLLDCIRKTNVVATESGGITQHIGACKIKTTKDKSVVFLDTPGHEAFTAMRSRGANVTDVAVLVVAADDGVMPQTEEAINHARAANVPIVVAINKCDKKDANLNRVKQQLSTLGLIPEEWGGNTVCVEVSALAGKNIDLLMEMLALEAELRELKANPNKKARGTVLEAKKTESRGVLANVLVQDGTLRRGDIVLCGKATGKVRSIHDEHGRALHEAMPSTPVEITGLSSVPEAGDTFVVVDDMADARSIAEDRVKRAREEALMARSHVTLDTLFSHIASGSIKEVKIILKTDVKGSLEVLKESLQNLTNKEVKLRIIHSGTGGINESDVILADASDAIIIGFHVVPDERARVIAKDKGVDVRMYEVIYQIIEDMKAALEGLLEPERLEVSSGHCTVKEVFRVSKVGNVAGCMVTNGKIERSAHVRLIRDNTVIYNGKLESLKRFKDDAREVQNGFECGLRIAGYDDIKVGDVIEAYQVQEIARKLTKS